MAQVSKKSCEICIQAPGTYYCVECDQLFCNNCKIQHKRLKLSEFHTFQLAAEVIPGEKSKCKEHQESFTFFCTSCYVTVCSSCVTGKHHGHTFSKIEDSIKHLNEDVSSKIQPRLQELDRNIKAITSGLQKFEGDSKSVIDAIEGEGNRIKEMIDKCVSEMIKAVKNETKQETTKVEMILNEMKSEIDLIQKFDKVRKDLDDAQPGNVLVKKLHALQIDLDNLKRTSPLRLPSISFSGNQSSEEDLKQLLGLYKLRASAQGKTITLKKGPTGLGFIMVGGDDSRREISVGSVSDNGAAAVEGNLKCGDQIISVNGQSLEGCTHDEAANIFKNAKGNVTLMVLSSLDKI